ncbi:MAG: 16S rRNA (adenine(1518)-N(6)/adenine(1519)-N(6))-dimethyltransferase RsmA [Candidatus Gracilibacteria bacterium]|nr:16S rRNA (adenine(1518)-N(6)/adenine(1519)-N(6))-dimethyltransferase RsmA [Candidatus Gracilibacteria bacterium]MDD2908484.1 16S rRNA (adenine(1518)-N(6)/adenine(1519)-N(6))-dimethyltransferase RsmA [Candidatus Gracilibacteria bacterium]
MSHLDIIKKYNIAPKKSLGQNFLVNDNILDEIVDFIDLENKNIIEVGPGYGALTSKILSKNPKSLELVELDKKMIEILNDRIENGELRIENINFKINNADILKFEPNYEEYLVVANIPYYITSPILTHFFYNTEFQASEMIILMQKDVGDKILKKSGNKNSVLSLGVDFACEEVKEIIKVGASNFIPPPKVESSVLYFKLKKDINKDKSKIFLKLIKAGFAEKRKKLISNLSKIGGYEKKMLDEIFVKLNLSDNVRAEELDLDKWNELLDEIALIPNKNLS